MLRASIDDYLALRRAVGFQLKTEASMLHDFARWASQCGETHVRAQTAMEWAATARSPWQRERRLRTVAAFARHARTEDPRHEVPATFVFARRHLRPKPYIYSPQELRRLLEVSGS
jgi:integrase/recombinase XerD